MAPSYEETVGVFKPGSITAIRLQNFLTYAKVEFKPGPRMNLVCGPNGTGKSTILNAMCLGLGGEPKHLGRADDARLFIMHEKDIATIEIDLEPYPGKERHVFRRKIDRSKGSERGNGRGASTFFINQEQVSAKEVRRVVQEIYHVSIDNLCTFLPQDRVGNFSGFTPQQLLEETQKSLSGNLYKTHQELIQLEMDLQQGGNNVETCQDRLKKLKQDFANIEREKIRMEERHQAEERLRLIEKKILWLEYDAQRELCLKMKEEKKQAKAVLNEAKQKVAPMEEKVALLQSQRDQMNNRLRTVDAALQKSKADVSKQAKKFHTHSADLESELVTLQTVDEEKRSAEKKLQEVRKQLEQAQTKLDSCESPEAMEERRRTEKAAALEARQPCQRLNREKTTLSQDLRHAKSRVSDLTSRLTKLNDSKANQRAKVFEKFDHLEAIYEYLNQNQGRFRHPVRGPIACEVELKTKQGADYLEQHVSNSTLKAFVVRCKEDYDLLYHEVRNKLKRPINIVTVGQFDAQVQRQFSDAKYQILKREHGVVGYLDEVFTACPEVMQALRMEAKVHKVLVGGKKTKDSIDNKDLLDFLTEGEGTNRRQGCCIFAPKGQRSFKYTQIISRYSGKASGRVDDIGEARFLGVTESQDKKKHAEEELGEAQRAAQDTSQRYEAISQQIEEATNAYQEAKARLEKADNDLKAIKKAGARIAKLEKDAAHWEEKAASDTSGEKKKLLQKLKARIKSSINAIEAHAAGDKQLLEQSVRNAGIRIHSTMVETDHRLINDELKSTKREFDKFKRDLTLAENRLDHAKTLMQEILQECNEKAPLQENGVELPLKEQLEGLEGIDSVEEGKKELEIEQEKMNAIEDNPEVMAQYDKLKHDIDKTEKELENMDSVKENKKREITRMQKGWESALNNSLGNASNLFSEYMGELNYAGQVVLSKGDAESNSQDFAKWGVAIQVKFREKGKMTTLNAQTHSGGERSVSTIMYLMALQELMVCPFRCVDEINQGLDERNERGVFKRIVQNSTKPPTGSDLANHSGQYFLITPKLLPNLTDMEQEAVTVHVITNGPYTFNSPTDWNPEEYRAIAIASQGDVGDENSPVIANGAGEDDEDEESPRKKQRR